MTTAGDPNLIYCGQVQGQNGVRGPEGGHHEERPCRGPGHLRCLRRQENALRRRPTAVNAGPVARFFRTTRFAARSPVGPSCGCNRNTRFC